MTVVNLKVLPWESLVHTFTGSSDLYAIVDTTANIEGMPATYVTVTTTPPLVSIEATDTSLVLNYGQAAALLTDDNAGGVVRVTAPKGKVIVADKAANILSLSAAEISDLKNDSGVQVFGITDR